MTLLRCTRRRFLALAGGTGGAALVRAQAPSLAHVNVAELERGRVLAEAKTALTAPLAPVTATPSPQGKPNHFFSETEPDIHTAGERNGPKLFRAHVRALRDFTGTVACLVAAYLLTSDAQYANRAAEHVRASMLTPGTRVEPSFDDAGCAPGTTAGTPAGVVDLVPLAELARALTFLVDSTAFREGEWDAVRAWTNAAYGWLSTNRAAVIARDTKDHRASAWLLIASSLSRYNRDEAALEVCRKRFRSPTLRNQIRYDGVFPQEVATPNPYRNTLFTFDLLTGACQVLSSPFDQLWTYELIDGVGMRTVSAYLYPVIAHPERWGFVADAVGFRELPWRRPGLLFAGRAFNRPEYVELWQKLPSGPVPENLAASFPIREPLLWTARAPHGL